MTPIRRGRRTAAHRGAAASRASAGAPRRRQAGVVRRRVRFFLTVKPNRSISSHSVLSAAVVGRASRNSASVRIRPGGDQRGQPLPPGPPTPAIETSFAGAARSIPFRVDAGRADAPRPGSPRTSRPPRPHRRSHPRPARRALASPSNTAPSPPPARRSTMTAVTDVQVKNWSNGR